MSRAFDAIVVGARCAGSPTAMLLARNGYRVLLVDRATFPSDTVSTHMIHPPGVAALARWGLLDRVVATGCPPVDTYAFDFGPFTISGRPGTPRRRSPTRPGERCWTSCSSTPPPRRESRSASSSRSRASCSSMAASSAFAVTRGAAQPSTSTPAWSSERTAATRSSQTPWTPTSTTRSHSCWPPLQLLERSAIDGRFETCIRPERGFAAWPTNDDLTLVIAGRPYREFEANRNDIERNFQATIDLAPAFAERLRAATREERFVGAAVRGFFRKPYGPGWALVGDAGYNKDFITAQGISDAFRDAELCATALDQTFSGTRGFEEALAEYQSTRTSRCCRCTSSRTTSRPSIRRRPSSSRCWQQWPGARRRWTSNLRPPACKAGALPAELTARAATDGSSGRGYPRLRPPPSTSGPGRHPFKVVARVRIPLGASRRDPAWFLALRVKDM